MPSKDVASSRNAPVNARIRKVIKTRWHFPNDEAAAQLIRLALGNLTKEWGMLAFQGRRP